MRGGAGASAPLNNSAYTDTHNIVDGYVILGPTKIGVGWVRNNVAAATHLQTDFLCGGNVLSHASAFLDARAYVICNADRRERMTRARRYWSDA